MTSGDSSLRPRQDSETVFLKDSNMARNKMVIGNFSLPTCPHTKMVFVMVRIYKYCTLERSVVILACLSGRFRNNIPHR